MKSTLRKWLEARRLAREEVRARQVFPDRPNKIKYYPGCSWFRVLGSKRLYLWLSTFGFTTHRPDDHYRGWRMYYKWGVCAVPPWRAENHGLQLFGRSRQELRQLIDLLYQPTAKFRGAVRLRTIKLLRTTGDFPLRVYDEFILWLWALVRRWLDAKVVADSIKPPPSRAQQALDALNTRVERWMEGNRVLRLIGELLACWEKLGAGAKVCCVISAAFVVGAIRVWWCVEPVELSFGAFLDTILTGLAVVFVGLVAANVVCMALLLVLFVLVLPLHLWRLTEVIGGFVTRHLLPRGIVWRYTWWRLRRTGRRRLCAALVDSEMKITPPAITLCEATFHCNRGKPLPWGFTIALLISASLFALAFAQSYPQARKVAANSSTPVPSGTPDPLANVPARGKLIEHGRGYWQWDGQEWKPVPRAIPAGRKL